MAAASAEDAEEASPTSKDKWLNVYKTGKRTCDAEYILPQCRSILLRQKSFKWHLYIYDPTRATATIVVSDVKNNTLEAALEAFKDRRVKLDRVVPLLPQRVARSWDCPICGERCYGPKDIQHVEEHLTMTKSASKT
jgi:hypothetical protein